jgi:phenylalanyl-tRNA synthetase alpha chain
VRDGPSQRVPGRGTWSGFAFGFGIDRMAKERHGVADLRDMFVNDIRFIEQF